jgi:hypothetical protein
LPIFGKALNMGQSKLLRKKKPGRPQTGITPVTSIRLPPELVEQIHAWAGRKTSRSKAIRWLVEIGLRSNVSPPKESRNP